MKITAELKIKDVSGVDEAQMLRDLLMMQGLANGRKNTARGIGFLVFIIWQMNKQPRQICLFPIQFFVKPTRT